jgi:hypothetical protein
MSDQAQPSAAVVNATQALAVKQANERIDALKKQVRALWITVAVIGVIALVSASFTLLPRFFGVRIGGGQFPGRSGTFNGQQFNQNGGGTQQGPQTTPAQ